MEFLQALELDLTCLPDRRGADIRSSIPVSGDPASRGQRWAFDVARTEGTSPEVRLDFDGVASVPRDLELRLIDRTLDRVVDLRRESSCRFVGARSGFADHPAETRFELVAGTAEFIASASTRLGTRPRLSRLLPCFPNLVTTNAIIRFETAAPGPVSLALYDLAGRRVRTLADDSPAPGVHELAWPGTDDQGRALPPGVYSLRLVASDRADVRKVVKIR